MNSANNIYLIYKLIRLNVKLRNKNKYYQFLENNNLKSFTIFSFLYSIL